MSPVAAPPGGTQSTQSPIRVVARAWPLLLSIALLMVGNGLQGTLLGLRAEFERFDSGVTGLVLGLFYLGFVIGSTTVPGLIRGVGHIRVFASLASMASAAVVIHGVWVTPVSWMALRFLTGVCMAGMFVVSESWLADVSTSRTRGTMLGTYNAVITAGLAVGSLLINAAPIEGFVLFVIGSSVISLAVVPVTLAPHEAPAPRAAEKRSLGAVFRAAPLGLVGSAVSGLGVASTVGFGAVYAARAGFGVSGASQLLAATLVGGVIGQVPLGRWSDTTDRRLVMATAAAMMATGSALGVVATRQASFPAVLLAGFVVGAGAFSLYGLSFSHVADYIDAAGLPAAGSRILTINGVAAATGPVLSAAVIAVAGPEGLFHLVGVTATVFVAFVLYRLRRRHRVAKTRRAHYTPVATSVTSAGIDELAAENLGLDVRELRRRRRRDRLGSLGREGRFRRRRG